MAFEACFSSLRGISGSFTIIPLIGRNLAENLVRYEIKKRGRAPGHGTEDELSLINLCFKLGLINLRARKAQQGVSDFPVRRRKRYFNLLLKKLPSFNKESLLRRQEYLRYLNFGAGITTPKLQARNLHELEKRLAIPAMEAALSQLLKEDTHYASYILKRRRSSKERNSNNGNETGLEKWGNGAI
ncbi:uncharacterized protein K444DRAFT_638512 [Hyaloscypha bicolor E]|uniref:Uncharacterized protein n=1 Tax=Hyaloscypha bicolor E TaxID=1095630 RepID=A0A2J6SGQ2_9HELO|nr:uncharacterized protein K444DRAFT_638512 [Hyaloscypha bicolor E]PMD49933.1 hypothetical protein K444DRAFT_638512 [Hyaloscypha bicolor E]